MVRGIVTRGLFYWLRAPRNNADIRADERILGIIRLLLGFCYLGALANPGSVPEAGAFRILAFLYLAYGLLVLWLLQHRRHLSPFAPIAIHTADILWLTQLATLVLWPEMAFVLFFFVLAASLFRWGFWETVLTSAAYFGFWVLGCYLHHPGHLPQCLFQGFYGLLPEALIYSGVVFTAGLIAEAKATRSGEASTARLEGTLRRQSRIEEAIGMLCSQGRQLFGATQILVVAQEQHTNRATLYRSIPSPAELQVRELEPSAQFRYLFPEPAVSMRLAIGRHPGNRPRCHTLGDQQVLPGTLDPQILAQFLSVHPFRILLASALAFEQDWIFRVFVVDPLPHFGGFAGLRWLHRTLHQLKPVFKDRFLVGRLKTHAGALAKKQVARELHDGVIQSLSCINMQLEALRQNNGMIPEAADPLAKIQHAVQQEIHSLRDFTHQLRALEIDSSRLLGYIAGMTVRFACEHGIPTRFIPEVDAVRATPRVCGEVARIIQEGLVNIRKHSRAQEANIRLGRQNGHYRLTIRDDGCGFGFSGRRSRQELQACGQGPMVLMERVRAIGGEIFIESAAGAGTSLEITFPAYRDNQRPDLSYEG